MDAIREIVRENLVNHPVARNPALARKLRRDNAHPEMALS